MSTTTGFGPTFRTAVLLAFVAGCVGFLGYLYGQAGGRLPLSERATHYRVSFDAAHVGNVVEFADVVEAGVSVGKVDALQRADTQTVRIVLTLDPVAAPLHQGAVVEVIERSLLGQPVVKLTDGTGPEFPDGSVLPPSAVRPPVTLRDVLASFDAPSRASLSGVIRSLGVSTDDRRPDVALLAGGLSAVGDQGDVALAALAAQSQDLSQVSRELRQVFDALDVGQGRIADLVTSANRLSQATAGQRPAIEQTMRKLPGVLDSATTASTDISRISLALAPVAADLRRAAPDLNSALDRMPDTTADVRGLLPHLQGVLHDAPDTLNAVPEFGKQARSLFPDGVDLLREFNPMARYIKPYGREISALFTNFGSSLNRYGDDGGSYLYVRPSVGAGSVRPSPIVLPDLIQGRNPLPKAGSLRDPQPFSGQYPKVKQDPP
jgi:phospholipid/cholesterol/gamma-HCH transport system substrate-binding protein